MEKQEYKNLLSKTANTVTNLVDNEVKKSHFRSRLITARQKDQEWEKALQKAMKEALSDPNLRNKAVKPGGGTWEWENYWPPRIDRTAENAEELERLEQGFWRKPLPFSPSIWAAYYYNLCSFATCPKPTEPKIDIDKERLLAEYVFLAKIHDEISNCALVDRLNDIDLVEHDQNVALTQMLLNEDNGPVSIADQVQLKGRLKDALTHVEADLAKKSAETEQKIKADEQKIINILKEYENEHGNKVGISPADLEREVEMTWPQLRPVLDRLGRKGLIEGHKGDGYTSYWLSVEFDEDDPLKHCCNIKNFRLTEKGRKLYTEPAEIEQGNKDAKSEGEGGFIDNTKPTIKKLLSKNFIKATIKHLPYFGPYLFDVIYGVNGIKAPKRENKSTNIVELLKKDYLLRTEDNLKQKIAEIAQDFTSRHLANTTSCINAQLQVHFEYNNKLIDHIIESLKQNHAATPLDKFKDKLLTVVDEQYKKLFSFANSRLVNAGLAQPSMFKEYEREINNKKQKAKQTVEATCAIFEKQKAAPEDKRDGKKEYEGRTIRVPKPWYKKIWVKIIGGLGVLVLITTLLLNLKAIKEWFYSPRIETSTPIETQLSLTNENKLSVTLKEICRDIDSRPLLQQEETAKRYIGINIQEEHLKLFDIHEYPEDGTFDLTMILPHESDESYLTGRKIFCTIERDKHPQLNAAKKGLEFYVSGQIKDAGSTYIELSDVSLKFD